MRARASFLKFSLFRYELVGKNDIGWMKTKTKIFAHLDFITSTILSFFLSLRDFLREPND